MGGNTKSANVAVILKTLNDIPFVSAYTYDDSLLVFRAGRKGDKELVFVVGPDEKVTTNFIGTGELIPATGPWHLSHHDLATEVQMKDSQNFFIYSNREDTLIVRDGAIQNIPGPYQRRDGERYPRGWSPGQ